MIERIEWNSHPDELSSPFLRGKGERPLRFTFHSQSLINLSDEEKSALQLLRELASLHELESFETVPSHLPYITLQEPDLSNDSIPVELIHNNKIILWTAIQLEHQWPKFVKDLSGNNYLNGETMKESLEALVFALAHNSIYSDIFVTKSSFLIENRNDSVIRETNPRTPLETAKIVGLFLRSRNNYVYRTEQKIKMAFNRGSFYWILARYRLPNMWKYFSACVSAGKTHNEDLQGLGESILIRSVRALEALDAIGIQFYLTQNHETSEQTMYHFDYLALVLSGALDAQARVANKVYKINKKEMNIGFQKDDFTKALRCKGAQGLFNYIDNQKFKDLKTLLYKLRNTIHAASLKTVEYHENAWTSHSLVMLPTDIKDIIWDAAERLNSAQRWGLSKKPGGIFLEPYSYSTSLVEETFAAINEIAAATDVSLLFTDSYAIPHLLDAAPENSHFKWGKRLSLLA